MRGTSAGLSRTRRILIVDDRPVMTLGLAQLIDRETDLEVCASVAASDHALDLIHARRPDAAVIEIPLADGDGLDLIRRLRTRCPDLPVLVLSARSEELYAERVLRAGADGYATTRTDCNHLLEALRRVLDGEIYLSRSARSRLIGNLTVNHRTRDPIARLSDRELQVFQLIGRGRSTREIAATLHVSISTVETHRRHLREKLSCASGCELTHRAIRWSEHNP